MLIFGITYKTNSTNEINRNILLLENCQTEICLITESLDTLKSLRKKFQNLNWIKFVFQNKIQNLKKR